MVLITVPALYSCGNWNQYHIIYHQVSLIFDNRRPLVIIHLAEIFYMLDEREHVFYNSTYFYQFFTGYSTYYWR